MKLTLTLPCVSMLATTLLLAQPALAAYQIQTSNGFQQTEHIYAGDVIRDSETHMSYQASGEMIITVAKEHAQQLFDSLNQFDVQLVLSVDKDTLSNMVVINAGQQDLLALQATLKTVEGVTQVDIASNNKVAAQ
ncbi:hypothetical protein A9264_06315 [Vibrio sp. UCD-FRSSP16_10]|uniref:hypothetical protein n=1 Tax=unclassified Vibrio TaxID=2614977 RepID=UPI0007FC54AF|nr:MULTISPECIES: hypothetical protein [unclassified Vibrio]OBT15898.1 hypothetical protein A9264_06315 [Vibrio sp. UCD-FRSSP16_10]OBT17792.1 hypothetical protein A9260_00310 [Vibrio sp. UCD-FRSSP16_30]